MMFDLINGIPWHPLVVHAVVVLLPLAVIGTIAIALVPRWRVRYGLLVVGCAALSTILLPVSTSSGEALEERVGDPGEHAELGDQLLFFAIPLVLLVAALVWLQWRRDRSSSAASTSGSPGAPTGGTGSTAVVRPAGRVLLSVAVLAVLVALANGVQVYRVGDSGAKAVWGDQVSSATSR